MNKKGLFEKYSKNKKIWDLAIIANLANIADIITTIIALSMGYSEGMAISRFLLSIHPIIFVIFKLLLVLYLTLPFRYGPIGYLVKTKNAILFKGSTYALLIIGFLICYFGYLAITNFQIIIS
jgi:hypothetical protein